MKPFSRYMRSLIRHLKKPVIGSGPDDSPQSIQKSDLSAPDQTLVLCQAKQLIVAEYGIYEGVLQFLLEEARISRLRYFKRMQRIKQYQEHKLQMLVDPAIHPLDLLYQCKQDLVSAMTYGEEISAKFC